MTYRISCGLVFLLAAFEPVQAADTKASSPSMAPLAQYLTANPADEIALARSAAPPSISNDAEVMILTSRGYETAVKGKNGFVCLVERSWQADFGDTEFWNSNGRAPICFNPAAAKTVLPSHFERTNWALAGLSRDEMLNRARTSAAVHIEPAPGAMCYMMSKQQHLSDSDPHWHPHLMFWFYNVGASALGANLPGSPVLGGLGNPNSRGGYAARPNSSAPGDPEPVATFLIPVSKWSDGTSYMDMHS